MDPFEQNLVIVAGAVAVLVLSYRGIAWVEAEPDEEAGARSAGGTWAVLLCSALFAAACGTALIAGANLVTAAFGRDPSRTSDAADGYAVGLFLAVTMGAFLALILDHFSTWTFRLGRLGIALFGVAFVATSWVDVVNSPPR